MNKVNLILILNGIQVKSTMEFASITLCIRWLFKNEYKTFTHKGFRDHFEKYPDSDTWMLRHGQYKIVRVL